MIQADLLKTLCCSKAELAVPCLAKTGQVKRHLLMEQGNKKLPPIVTVLLIQADPLEALCYSKAKLAVPYLAKKRLDKTPSVGGRRQ